MLILFKENHESIGIVEIENSVPDTKVTEGNQLVENVTDAAELEILIDMVNNLKIGIPQATQIIDQITKYSPRLTC